MDELLKLVERLTQRVNKSEERLRQAEEKLKTLTQYIHSKFKDKNIEPTSTPEPEPTIGREFSDPKLISHSIVRLKRMGVVCSLVPVPDKDLESRKSVAANKDMVESHHITQFKSEIPESVFGESLNQLRTFLIQNNLPFSCSICTNSFRTKILLTQHHQISHSKCYVRIDKLSQFSKNLTNQNNKSLNVSPNAQNFTVEIEPPTPSIISISTNIFNLSDAEDNCEDHEFEPISIDNDNECDNIEECNQSYLNTNNISTEKTQVIEVVKKPAKNSKKRKNSDLIIEADIETLNLRRSDRKRKKLLDLIISDNEAEDLLINSDVEYNPQEDSQDISMQNEAEENNVLNFSRQKSRRTFKQKLSSQARAKEVCKNCSLKFYSKTGLMNHRFEYHFNYLSKEEISEYAKLSCIEDEKNSTENRESGSNTKKYSNCKMRFEDKTPYSKFMIRFCLFCEENFLRASFLLSHLVSAHGTDEILANKMAGFGKFHCNKCEFQIFGHSKFIFHTISTHLNELSEEEIMQLNKVADLENMKKLVGKTNILSKSAYKINNNPSAIEFYKVPPKCMDCDMIFSQPDNFVSHLMSTHELTEEDAKKNEGFSKISCNYCNSELNGTWHSLSHQIKYHLYEMNEEEKNFLVKYTGKEIKDLKVKHSLRSNEHEKNFFDQEEKSEIGVKILRTYFNYIFKCSFCYALFTNENYIFFHLKNFHNKGSYSREKILSQVGYGNFTCNFPDCSYTSNKKWILTAHMLTSHFNSMSQSERDENLAQIHVISTKYIDESAKDDESLKCPVAECSTQFSTKRSFYTHLTNEHNYGEKKARELSGAYLSINCNYCSAYYSTNYKIVLHILKFHHGIELQESDKRKIEAVTKNTTFYRCDTCSVFYETNVEKYVDHLKLLHPERYKSEYLDNPERSKMKNKFKARKNSSKSVKVSCETCGKTINKGSLARHKRSHLPSAQDSKDLKCSFPNCTYVTWRFNRLRAHEASHSEERNFKCELCPFAAKAQNNLRAHMTINHNSDPLLCCELCGDKFRTQSRLNIHIRGVHLNLRPHACTLCPQKFKARHHLTNHLKSHEDTRKRPSWPKGEQKERIVCPRRQGYNKIQNSTQIVVENNVIDNVDIDKANGVVDIDIDKILS